MTPERHLAKRKWGQNFLIDRNIAKKILDAAEIRPQDRVLEIGPGQGILTQGLLERGANIRAIEIDGTLVQKLKEHFLDAPDALYNKSNFDLLHGDALDHPYGIETAPFKVVANLPYNISSPLLFRLLEEGKRISRMVLMLQKEVAERIVSKAAEKNYGRLSVMVQYHCEVRLLLRVSPTCFRPRPKVASAVLLLTPLDRPRVNLKDEALFRRVVKTAFQHRRKQLPNALGCAGFEEDAVLRALQQLRIDPKRRGETLTLQDFAGLSEALRLSLPRERV